MRNEHAKGKLVTSLKAHHVYLECITSQGNVRIAEVVMPYRTDTACDIKHLLGCWNSHDELLAACDEGLHECERVKMHCSCPDKDLGGLLKRIERIEAAIANAEKGK